MKHILDSRYALREGRRRLASDNLKRCPLCGAVNAKQSAECFVCAWQGEFETHPQAIEEGLDLLIEQCPELSELLTRRPTFWERMGERISAWTRSLFRRRFDTYA